MTGRGLAVRRDFSPESVKRAESEFGPGCSLCFLACQGILPLQVLPLCHPTPLSEAISMELLNHEPEQNYGPNKYPVFINLAASQGQRQ